MALTESFLCFYPFVSVQISEIDLMHRQINWVLGAASLLAISLSGTSGFAQMRGPRINNVRDVTCVANWERRFKVISPGMWEMRMGPNDRNPFIFRETNRYTGAIALQAVHNRQLKALLNLRAQQIAYTIPDNPPYDLYFDIQSFNINGGGC